MRPGMAALLIAGSAGLTACTADTGSYGYGTGLRQRLQLRL